MKKNKKGFTLAEVLIALTIIGVIAAITVPVLNQSSQDKEIAAALKKNYSVFKQVLSHYFADTGELLTSSEAGFYTAFKPKLMKYVNNIKDCGYGHAPFDSANKTKACLSSAEFSEKYKTYNGNSISFGAFDDGQFILADGTAVYLNSDNGGTFISVDVNGSEKKPNRLGKDLFVFQLMPDGNLVPGGVPGSFNDAGTYCSDTSSSNMNGAACTYKVLQK